MNQIAKNKFFNDLAIQMGVSDLKFVKQAYFAFVRVVVKGLKEKEEIKLPDFGTFKLMDLKAHKIGKQLVPDSKTIRFNADYKLRGYFRIKQ